MVTGTATARFAGLPELLRSVAEVIRNRQQLAKLRLVNKSFCAAATTFLFSDIDIQVDNFASVAHHEKNPHFDQVRKLSIKLAYQWHPASGPLNDDTQRMLLQVPLLQSFECHSIPISLSTLRMLHKSCRKVKSIDLRFPHTSYGARPPSMTWADEATGYPFRQRETTSLLNQPSLPAFGPLEEVILIGLYNDIPWWKTQIVQLLKRSPDLRKLHLSISDKVIIRYRKQGQFEAYVNFFDRLCDEYGDTAASPLSLESLYCGTGVYPCKLASLKRLTNLSCLEEVHIANKDRRETVDIAAIDFSAFGPVHSPNLRRFTTTKCRGDVYKFLATIEDPKFARQLAVSCWEEYWYKLARLRRPFPLHPCLPLHFRMLDIGLDADLMDSYTKKEERRQMKRMLKEMVLDDDGALEGLTVQLPAHEGVDHIFDHLDLLEHALTKLANLTQLAVVPLLRDLPRTDDETPEEIILWTAGRLGVAAPRLRYIKIEDYCYRICRERDRGTVRLEELDDREIGDVELFNRTIYEPDFP